MKIDKNLAYELKNLVVCAFEESKHVGDIQKKELNDIVTYTDLYIEKCIINQIKQWFPEHDIDSEEVGEQKNGSDYEWIIDPIDGTVNFAADIPIFATSIALKYKNETIFGFIYDFSNDDLYYAIKNQGAYCNEKKLSVSKNTKLQDSIISFCLTSHYNENHIRQVLQAEANLASKVRGLRLIVSSTIELAWCAAGKTEGVINIKPSKRISSRAGMLLVQEAGGKITNLKGKNIDYADTLIASNGLVHNELVNALNYTVFIGNITDVIEINNTKGTNSYLAGKAYSCAVAAAKLGANVKLLTVMSGKNRKGVEQLYKELEKNSVDISYIKLSDKIENDIKIILKDENEVKLRTEDILHESACAININFINENINLINEARFIVLQTKIDPDVTKYIIEYAYENKIDVILNPSRPKNISCVDNNDNYKLIEKIKYLICTKDDLKIMFGNKANDLDILKKYQNKLILISEDKLLYYDEEYVEIKYTSNLNAVGNIDVFIGNFINYLSEGLDFKQTIEKSLNVIK